MKALFFLLFIIACFCLADANCTSYFRLQPTSEILKKQKIFVEALLTSVEKADLALRERNRILNEIRQQEAQLKDLQNPPPQVVVKSAAPQSMLALISPRFARASEKRLLQSNIANLKQVFSLAHRFVEDLIFSLNGSHYVASLNFNEYQDSSLSAFTGHAVLRDVRKNSSHFAPLDRLNSEYLHSYLAVNSGRDVQTLNYAITGIQLDSTNRLLLVAPLLQIESIVALQAPSGLQHYSVILTLDYLNQSIPNVRIQQRKN